MVMSAAFASSAILLYNGLDERTMWFMGTLAWLVICRSKFEDLDKSERNNIGHLESLSRLSHCAGLTSIRDISGHRR